MSLVLEGVTGCVKEPRVFTFLSEDESRWLSEATRDDLALRLRASLARISA